MIDNEGPQTGLESAAVELVHRCALPVGSGHVVDGGPHAPVLTCLAPLPCSGSGPGAPEQTMLPKMLWTRICNWQRPLPDPWTKGRLIRMGANLTTGSKRTWTWPLHCHWPRTHSPFPHPFRRPLLGPLPKHGDNPSQLRPNRLSPAQLSQEPLSPSRLRPKQLSQKQHGPTRLSLNMLRVRILPPEAQGALIMITLPGARIIFPPSKSWVRGPMAPFIMVWT
mmetsp:Transcript_8599/g.20425  ORF Transcript_8599/g.20425 Transcript_8599/m.20425 type:complete len:223 (-) Transcript_8599:1597-2265(-)